MARISIDGVWRETLAEARLHFAAFATLTAAFVFLPALLFGVLVPADLQHFQMPVPGTIPHFPIWFWPVALLGIVLQSLVTLTIGAIAGDPVRPGHETVGATIARMLPALLRYLGALLLLFVAYLLLAIPVGLALGLLFGALAAVGQNGAMTSPGPAIAVALLAIVPLLLWVGARLSPMVGVFAVERPAPVAGIRRAWRLSDGAGGRIMLLIIITSIAAILVAVVVQGLAAALGSAAVLAGAGTIARLLLTTIAAVVNALLFILFSAGLGVIYRQLRTA